MESKVIAALSKQLKIEESKISMNSKIQEDLGADSLDIMEMLMNIELDYGITIPDEDVIKFETVADIVKYVDSHTK